jgi:redox-sensitive bicupin YhaK (pirin superfamily)
MTRKIKKVMKSKPTIEGAGVHLKRAFGYHQVPMLDPFLLLDDFHSDNPDDYLPGFPWHPHRGIETITYMLGGEVEHGDSMGNKGIIRPGDIQWMTAGSGIIHQEMPKGKAGEMMQGFQLWANLPASKKMMNPRYQDVKQGEIPEVTVDGGTSIKIICGSVNGISGPVKDIVIDPEYLDITVPPETIFIHKVKKGYTVFAYVIHGCGHFEEGRDSYSYEMEGANYFDMDRNCSMKEESLIIFDDGDEVIVTAGARPVRFILVSGKPIKEPVAWYGPIVMNTQEELKIAFSEYQAGTFVKHGSGKNLI